MNTNEYVIEERDAKLEIWKIRVDSQGLGDGFGSQTFLESWPRKGNVERLTYNVKRSWLKKTQRGKFQLRERMYLERG